MTRAVIEEIPSDQKIVRGTTGDGFLTLFEGPPQRSAARRRWPPECVAPVQPGGSGPVVMETLGHSQV